MSTVDKNPVVKARSGEVRSSEASGMVDAFEMKARVNEILNRRPAVGLAVGVVRNGSLEFFQGHGLANIESNTPITEDTVFRIASITKTFTAIAVMQLWEQGLVDLDAPANDYLRAYKLIPARASFRPATVRHLLTHTAGIPEVVYASDLLHPGWGPFGARPVIHSVKVGEPMPELPEYYRGGLRLVVEPGSAFAYSNHGFATLGQIIEDVSGMPLERYLREHLFSPLGMADSDLVRSDLVASRLATGYVLGPGGARAVPDREWIGEIYSTPKDMARYVAALLGGGANEHGRVLKPSTMTMMFDPHYQPDPRIPGIGLAFFRANLGGHLAVEHGGILPGFNSEIFVAPDDGVGVMAFTNGASGAMGWLPLELGQLLRHLLDVPDEIVRNDVPQHISDLRVRVMMGGGAQVFVRGGQLMVRGLSPIPALYRGLPLHPDDETDPYVFRLDTSKFGMPTVHVVFGHEVGVGTTAVHTDLGSQPVSLFKRPATRRPGASLILALGALAVFSAVRAFRRRRRPDKGV
jgi:CubicO group peptidase (beta-lactamase class C family)